MKLIFLIQFIVESKNNIRNLAIFSQWLNDNHKWCQLTRQLYQSHICPSTAVWLSCQPARKQLAEDESAACVHTYCSLWNANSNETHQLGNTV